MIEYFRSTTVKSVDEFMSRLKLDLNILAGRWGIPKIVHTTGRGSHYQRYNTLMASCSFGDSLTIHKVMRS